MRNLVGMAACVALIGCADTSEVENAERNSDALADTATAPAEGAGPAIEEEREPATNGAIELTPTGFVAGGKPFRFDAGRTEVQASLESLLAAPTGGGPMEECGAGPMVATDYAGGLTVNFMDNKFVGWNLRLPEDGDAPAPVNLSVKGPAQLGTARSKVEVANGFEMYEESTLGDEFSIGEVSGFFENGEVSMLYSGTQCFFR